MKRYSLDELKAMTGEQLYGLWGGGGSFPFDKAICGSCLTLHSHRSCHQEITTAIHTIASYGDWHGDLRKVLKEHIEELYALRLFYDPLYPQPASEPPLPPKETPQVEEFCHTPCFRR